MLLICIHIFYLLGKQCIESENQFDFLKDLVSNIADMPNQDEEENADSSETKAKKPYVTHQFCSTQKAV